jgi:hypothetical protein
VAHEIKTVEGLLAPWHGLLVIHAKDVLALTQATQELVEYARLGLSHADDGEQKMIAAATKALKALHPKVKFGQCPICLHFGDDCTGL